MLVNLVFWFYMSQFVIGEFAIMISNEKNWYWLDGNFILLAQFDICEFVIFIFYNTTLWHNLILISLSFYSLWVGT